MIVIKNSNIKLEDLVYFVIKNYPVKSHLSKARLTKIIFLMDWKYCLDYWEQITNINWYFDTYGPYVPDIVNLTQKENSLFKTNDFINFFNNLWTIIDIKNSNYNPEINNNIKEVFQFIINATSKLNFSDFINFVYSTYPIQVSNRFSYLNLEELSNQYKNN